MNDKPRLLNLSDESPWFQLFMILLIIIGIGSLLTLLTSLAGAAIFGLDIRTVLGSESIAGNEISFLRYILIVQEISFFIIPSIVILYLSGRKNGILSAGFSLPPFKDLMLVIVMTCCLFPITSFTGAINSALHLPSALSGIEEWMIEKEKSAENLIYPLLSSEGSLTILLNLITIAIVPAISEELFFRGVFQKLFCRLFRSGNIGIWFTAIIFSAVHFQFFGFLPRLILGLAFGYLYYWSGKLWLPILAHFVNNALPVILAFLNGSDSLNELTETALWKQAVVIPVPVAIVVFIMIYFRNQKKESAAVSASGQ